MQKITIITVAFNACEQLEETIQNVTLFGSNLTELIIIDGGSNDGTLQLLEKYSNHLKYWVSEPDNGIYDAMNKGWHAADNDALILFLGAGDKLLELPSEIDPNAITYGKVLLGSSSITFNSNHSQKLKFSNTLHHQALIVPKHLHPQPPFNLAFPTYADFDFNQRLLKQGHKFNEMKGFVSYAAPDGVSAKLDKQQMVKVTLHNFGIWYALLSWLYCSYYQLRQARMAENN